MNVLEQAADLLENFQTHWEKLEGKPEAQHELIKLIVERVYVRDEKVVAMTLRSNYHLVLGHNVNGPTYHEVDPLYSYGSDGLGHRSGHRCVVWIPYHKTYGLLIGQLIETTKPSDLQAGEYVAQARD
jgi:hypothetical protein